MKLRLLADKTTNKTQQRYQLSVFVGRLYTTNFPQNVLVKNSEN